MSSACQVTHRGVRLDPHVALAMQELTLKVRHLDHVRITDADRADARRRQVQEELGAAPPAPTTSNARGKASAPGRPRQCRRLATGDGNAQRGIPGPVRDGRREARRRAPETAADRGRKRIADRHLTDPTSCENRQATLLLQIGSSPSRPRQWPYRNTCARCSAATATTIVIPHRSPDAPRGATRRCNARPDDLNSMTISAESAATTGAKNTDRIHVLSAVMVTHHPNKVTPQHHTHPDVRY